MPKKYKRGYTQGCFDMFHIGHLNLINHAKEQCDYLIVGVNSDDLIESYKHKRPIISQEDRCSIVENIKAVDKAVIVDSLDKIDKYKKYDFDAIFIGDDWKNNDRWKKTVDDLKKYDVDVVFLPYTKGISSTGINEKFQERQKHAEVDS